jgi:hypothetical protein
LLGHRGAWFEGRFPSMNEGNEITIKYGFENYELILNENEREVISTAEFGVCATRRILRVSHTSEHTF